MRKKISVPYSVYLDLKSLKRDNEDSFGSVISRLIKETSRKAKKEDISDDLRKSKYDPSSIIDKESRGVMDLMELLLVKMMYEEVMKTSVEKQTVLSSEALKASMIKSITKSVKDQLFLSSVEDPHKMMNEDLTIKERLSSFLRYDERSPKDWFTSSQAMNIYKEVFGETIQISTVSTYLSNMYSEGILERKGSRARRQYRLASVEIGKAVSTSPVGTLL